ncbi:Inosine-5'-monophosphate dehydrogenase [[Actinomadura] parvosata subsp. kistnae]|uniref:hypothetical protein n=1 Tax=[Actinomadura] parvosata TaxID=1955412 RepID=UPI000D2E13C6|nr:hypothetical protein [Nonomuraea sp. ATCC 55076]SPL87733.1 Inosine-5'-monophosphate dehydrogenase [Actinomadura parvosata subsp. kistnae]
MRMTVADVMTAKVVTVTATTPFKEIAAIAARMTRRVNGVVDVVDKLTWKSDDSEWEAR